MRKMRGVFVVALTLALIGGLVGIAWAADLFPSTDSGQAELVDLPASYRSEDIGKSSIAALPPDEDPASTSMSSSSLPYAVSTSFSYYHVPGATLRGRYSTTEFGYDGTGCVHVNTGGERILNTELHIPNGSVIKYIRLYYIDTSASANVSGYLTRYQPGQQTSDLVATSSTSAFAGGYGYVVSTELNEVVNNLGYAYTLIGWPSTTGSTVQVCGIRVAYYAPLGPAAYLPTIRK